MIFEKLLARWGYAKAQVESPPAWLGATAEAQRFEIMDGSLWRNQAELYQRLSWVLIAVSHTASMVAKTPLRVMQRKGEKLSQIDNHPFEVLLDRPNPTNSRYELLYSIAAYRALTGNGYWDINRGGPNEPPQELYTIPTPNCWPRLGGQLIVEEYEYDPGNGQIEHLPAWRVLHCKTFHPANPFVGMSPIEALAVVATGDLAMQKWNTNWFGKDNAKPAGILAFKDRFQGDQWKEMQQQVKDEYGGTKRQLMMLHGVGQGQVNWVQTALTQKDMEFLGARRFNKEEILAVYAPGLASMLDVNATEANAKAGERIFRDYCYEQMDALAQSITNRILPAYGPDLVAQFDDIRITDRSLELAEQGEYARVHTVDEVRAKYYDDDPLGDDRGLLLPAQVGPATGLPGQEPATVVPVAPEGGSMAEEPEEPAVEATEQKRHTELHAWRRYALKRKGEDAAAFKCEHVPGDVAEVIRGRLLVAGNAEEVKAAFSGPFLIKAARVDRKGKVDPNADAKDSAEQRLARLLKAKLDGQYQEVRDLLGDPPDINNLPPGFWDTQAGQMVAAIRPELEDMAMIAAQRLMDSGVGVSWDLAAETAARWAEQYGYDLIKGITETTRRVVQDAVARYIREKGTTIGDLYKRLEPWFGKVRAEMISVTEVTRAYAAGEALTVAEAQRLGMRFRRMWHTNRDELVCGLCEPMDNEMTDETPPKHPRCRCWITHEWIAPNA
ncbi:MAG TPA: phage portal protein [Verrucomicrobiota bacterium]|nr:phage portal protein [Verrucomicrobiota bacterium]